MTFADPTAAEIRGQIDELQNWFASRPTGFRDHASPEQLQQFEDREREADRLIDALADRTVVVGSCFECGHAFQHVASDGERFCGEACHHRWCRRAACQGREVVPEDGAIPL